MKSRQIIAILAMCLMAIFGFIFAGSVDSELEIPQSGAMDKVTAFEIQAGIVGRAELYARESLAFSLQATPTINQVYSPDLPIRSMTDTLTYTTFLPLAVSSYLPPMIERRGIWVTRYDWTSSSQTPSPADIYDIVTNVSNAGFNAIFFQIRAAGDSFYTPGLEPWSARLTTGPVSETLGVDPGWDPLAVMLETAHAAGIEVHAYFNLYTAWLAPPDESQGALWPPATTPAHMFDLFTYGPSYTAHPGLYALGYKWRQYAYPDTPMALNWNHYLWASPGVDEVQDHIANVAEDILSRYAVDGLHLDLVRYAGPTYSYDPASNASAGAESTPERDQWQRDRVTALVNRLSMLAHSIDSDMLVSAAVWPIYIDYWSWGTSEGYSDYFQDSKGWIQNSIVDAIAPMLYGGVVDDFTRWQTLMTDFVAASDAGTVYPGIGVYDDFSSIEERIWAARQAQTEGHIIFSYSGLLYRDYWDDLADGPYRYPVNIPQP